MRDTIMLTTGMSLLAACSLGACSLTACAEPPSEIAEGSLLPVDVTELAPAPAGLTPKEDAPGVTLGSLKTRDRILRIRAGADGPTYVVTTHEGEVIDEGLDAQALARRHPELSAALERGTASDGAVLDATLDLPSSRGAVEPSSPSQGPAELPRRR